jgi:peptidoglycan DL-endopeptidase CwlO
MTLILIMGIGDFSKITTASAEELVVTKSEELEQVSNLEVVTIVNDEKTKIENDLIKLNEQMKRLEEAISDNLNFISKTEQEMSVATSELNNLGEEVNTLKEQINKRNEVLKERALTYQESGGKVSFLGVFLGASGFTDLIERVGVVTKIVNADQDLLEQHQADKKSLETKQKTIQKKLAELTSMQTELKGMQEQLFEQKLQNELLKEQLENKQTTIQMDLTNAVAAMKLVEDIKPVASKVITAGYKYIGNSVYVFGGGRNEQDIEKGRFDCSAFVHWAFAQAGINLGSSTDTIKNSGKLISVSEMEPGDLVFFDTYKKDGHVGIYLGDGKFIGSQSTTGVAIADMVTGYWNETFKGHVERVITE